MVFTCQKHSSALVLFLLQNTFTKMKYFQVTLGTPSGTDCPVGEPRSEGRAHGWVNHLLVGWGLHARPLRPRRTGRTSASVRGFAAVYNPCHGFHLQLSLGVDRRLPGTTPPEFQPQLRVPPAISSLEMDQNAAFGFESLVPTVECLSVTVYMWVSFSLDSSEPFEICRTPSFSTDDTCQLNGQLAGSALPKRKYCTLEMLEFSRIWLFLIMFLLGNLR